MNKARYRLNSTQKLLAVYHTVSFLRAGSLYDTGLFLFWSACGFSVFFCPVASISCLYFLNIEEIEGIKPTLRELDVVHLKIDGQELFLRYSAGNCCVWKSPQTMAGFIPGNGYREVRVKR